MEQFLKIGVKEHLLEQIKIHFFLFNEENQALQEYRFVLIFNLTTVSEKWCSHMVL